MKLTEKNKPILLVAAVIVGFLVYKVMNTGSSCGNCEGCKG